MNIAMVVKGKQETEAAFVAFQDYKLQKSVVCNYLNLFVFETVGTQLKFCQCASIIHKKKIVIQPAQTVGTEKKFNLVFPWCAESKLVYRSPAAAFQGPVTQIY